MLKKDSAEYKQVQKLMGAELEKVYQKNMSFFKRVNHRYFLKFNKYIPKRFALKLTEKGYINLVNLSTGVEVYPEDPTTYARKQVSEFLEKRPHFVVTSKMSGEKGENQPYTNFLDKTNSAYNELVPKTVQGDEHLVEQLFMFGSGLGLQLQYVLNNLDVKNLTIFEPDEDSLFFSLYIIDWEQILSYFNRPGYSFQIYSAYNSDKNIDTISTILSKGGYHRCSKIDLYYHYFNDELKKISKNLKYYLKSVMGALGYFEDECQGFKHTLKNIKAGVPYSVYHQLEEKTENSYKALVVGNGPSLDLLEDFIKSKASQFIVISCGTALASLIKKGIIPDIHVEQERITLVKKVLEGNIKKKVLDEICFVGLNTCFDEVYEMFKNSHMVMKPQDLGVEFLKQYSNSKFIELLDCNPLVSNFGITLSMMLGFKEIYLAGVDCGMVNTGYHHSKASIYYPSDDTEDSDRFHIDQEMKHIENDLNNDLFRIKGNLRNYVLTNTLYNSSKISIERSLNRYKPQCYNLSDGVAIEGASALLIEDFKEGEIVENKKWVIQELCKACFSNNQINALDLASQLGIFKSDFEKNIENIVGEFDISNKSLQDLLESFDRVESLLRTFQCNNVSFYRLISGSLRGIMINIITAKKVFNEKSFQQFADLLEPELDVFFQKVRETVLEF